MAKTSDFVATMLAYLKWFLLTLDPEFTKPLLNGRTVEEAAKEVFDNIASTVRGNRPMKGRLTSGDYGAIMDHIADLHLRTRHGEKAVSQNAVFGNDMRSEAPEIRPLRRPKK